MDAQSSPGSDKWAPSKFRFVLIDILKSYAMRWKRVEKVEVESQ